MGEVVLAKDGLFFQLAAFAGNEPEQSYLEIRCIWQGTIRQEFIPAHALWEILTKARDYRNFNVYIGAAPRIRESGSEQDVERVWTLWADCDSDGAVKKLRKFRPWPAIVAKTSPDRLQAIWPLKEPVDGLWARKANRRLAYHLGADMAATDPARILRAIGTRNHKHNPPFVVECPMAEAKVFDIREVVGELPDVPVPQRQPYMGPPQGSVAGLVRVVQDAARGDRNQALFWAGCCDSEGNRGAREALRQAGLDAGLPEFEVERTLDSAARRILGCA